MTPALLTSVSRRPSSPTVVATAPSAWAGSVTSASITRARPAPPMRSARASSRSRRRATRATVAPSSASAMDVASPMPLLAPVTRATVPSSLFVMEPPPRLVPAAARPYARSNGTRRRPARAAGPGGPGGSGGYPASVGSFSVSSAVPARPRRRARSRTARPATPRSCGHPGRRVAVEDLAPEEGGAERGVDEHQDDAEDHRTEVEEEDAADLPVGDRHVPRGVAVDRVPVVPERPPHGEPQHQPTRPAAGCRAARGCGGLSRSVLR